MRNASSYAWSMLGLDPNRRIVNPLAPVQAPAPTDMQGETLFVLRRHDLEAIVVVATVSTISDWRSPSREQADSLELAQWWQTQQRTKRKL